MRVLADRYRIERKLGEGGMAEVFLVHDALAGRPLALKLLKAADSSRDYFMHEFRILARLDHPNLIRVFDFGAAAGEAGAELCYYTCELLTGEDLFAATRGMDFESLYQVVGQVLEALGYIHERGLVHYDVKPENVSVLTLPATRPGMRPQHRVKLVDFGLTGEAITRRGEKIKGTVHYVAPEVAKSLPADRRADLYSLGITLYYVVTGALPYDGDSAISILRKHIEQAPEPPASLRADIPEAWAGFILRLMEKEPARRYASAHEAMADLCRRLSRHPEPWCLSEEAAGGAGEVGATARPAGLASGRARRASGGDALSPRFVGRSEQLARLVASLPAADEVGRGPRVVWIEGDEGVGKTRLIYELKVQAQLLGVPFLDSVCLKEGARPFERIVRLALTQPEVRALAEDVRPELEALFPGILGADPPAADASAPSADGARGERALAGGAEGLRLVLARVAGLLLRAAEARPYVLVIEDIRRANEITVALLGMLLRALVSRAARGRPPGAVDHDADPDAVQTSGAGPGGRERRRGPPPLLVVLTDRPGGESGEMIALAEGIPEELAGEIVEDLSELRAHLDLAGLLESMPLDALEEEETGALVGSMLALAEPPPALVAKVHAVTRGNPLFTEELVRSLLEDGVLSLRRTAYGAADLERMRPPRTLGELLGQRLARLPEDARAVLAALAVLVAPSPLRLVAATAERSPAAALDALDVLVRRQMVRRLEDEDEGATPRFRLGHAQVERSVLGSIGRPAREATHRRALAALERELEAEADAAAGARGATSAGDAATAALDPALDRLARHALQGGLFEAALRYATAAGVRAQEQGNPQQAIDLLDRALELLRWEDVGASDAERRAQEVVVLTRLSEVLSTVGRYKDAARALEELLALGDDVLGSPAVVWVRRRLGDLAVRQGSSAEARRWLDDALAAADGEDVGLRAERARVLEVMCRTALWRGDYLGVISLAGEAIQTWRELGREPDALWALNLLSVSEYYRGQTGRATDHLRESLALTRRGDAGYRPLLDRLGFSPDDQQDLDRRLRAFEASRGPVRREAGDAFGLVLSFSAVGTVFDLREDLDASARFYEAALAAYERLGDAQRTALAHNNLAILSRHAGRFAAALEHLEDSLAIHEGTNDRQGGAVALVNLALLLLALGDADGALARARRALAIGREIGLTWLTGHCHRVLGHVLALQGSLPDADRELQRAAGVFRMIGNLRSLADLLLDRAEIAHHAGLLDEMAIFLGKARATGEEEKAADFLSRQRLLQGYLLLASDPPRAVDELEAALRLAGRARLAELDLAAHRALARAYTRLGTLRLAEQHLDRSHEVAARLTAGLDRELRERFELSPGSVRERETSRHLLERSLEDGG